MLTTLIVLAALAASPPPAGPPPAPPRETRPAARAPTRPPAKPRPGLAGGVAADPLAPARSGRVQCQNPDIASRRCGAISRFVFLPDGGILAVADVRLGSSPLMILRTETPVAVRDGQVCGDLRNTRISQLTIDGQPARPEEVSEVNAAMRQAWQEDFGKQSCSRYLPDGDQMAVETSVDGVPRPESRRRMMWIDPDSGFSVAP
ncbi:MAG: hypothetical protein KF842_06215 [Caulobacter sp.]|nr:hypothetical protein [Caulobacter sp.]